jgi:hypothetical protein
MKNTNLLIGAGVVVVGYLLWKKSQSNSVVNNTIITPKTSATEYSKECYDRLRSRLQQKDAKPPNFQKKFLEDCSLQNRVKQMECESRYSELMQPSVVMPQEYWDKRKEDWMKINCK